MPSAAPVPDGPPLWCPTTGGSRGCPFKPPTCDFWHCFVRELKTVDTVARAAAGEAFDLGD